MAAILWLCWHILAASLQSQRQATQHDAQDGQRLPQDAQHSPEILDFGKVFGVKLRAKLTKKSSVWPLVGKSAEIAKKYRKNKNNQFFNFCWAPRPSNVKTNLTKTGPQSDQKSSKNVIDFLVQFLIDFLAFLRRFWEGLGPKLPKLATR